jgi:ATP-dependent protease ClpP protease subunit
VPKATEPLIQPQMRLQPSARSGEAELIVYGDIGESWWGESLTAKAVVDQLQALDPSTRQINVRINSYGGSVADGLAIYNALRAHPAKVVARIDGVAMSIASLILMAGDEVQAPETSLLMIHAPWGGVVGNAEELRRYADVLDTYAEAMVSAYATKSGLAPEAILELLTDGQDHYYTGAEAVAAGFADALQQAEDAGATTDESAFAGAMADGLLQRHLKGAPENIQRLAIAAAARNRIAASPAAAMPAPPAHTTEDITMPIENQGAAAGAQQNPAPVDPNAVLAADKARRTGIRELFARFNTPGLDTLRQQCEDDTATTVEAAGQKLLAKLAEGAEPLAGGAGRYEVGRDLSQEHYREGVTAALLHRANPGAHAMTDKAREFRGSSLVDLAREACARAGVNTRGMNQREVAVKALHSTSDFPFVLENIITKSLRAAYESTPRSFVPFCRQATLPDFKEVSRVQLGGAPNLKRVIEGAEYEQGTIGEGREKYALSKYGRIVAVTWETIVNDDLDAFTRLPAMFGRSAADLESDLVYAILTGNPAMADGNDLFSGAHGNLGTAAALQNALNPALANPLNEMQELMMLQKGIEGRYITVRPEYLIVPPRLAETALRVTAAGFAPNAAGDINVIGRTLTPIVEPRLQDSPGTATNYFGAASPNAVDTIEYAYLDGEAGPFTEARNGFEVDGLQVKCRHVFGTKAIDWRGLFKNAGAAFPAG